MAAAQVLNDGRSRRAIAAGLAGQGFVTPSGAHYSATSIKRMLGEGGSKSRALTHYDAKGRNRALSGAEAPEGLPIEEDARLSAVMYAG